MRVPSDEFSVHSDKAAPAKAQLIRKAKSQLPLGGVLSSQHKYRHFLRKNRHSLASNLHFSLKFVKILSPQSFQQRYLQTHYTAFGNSPLSLGGVLEWSLPHTKRWFKYHKIHHSYTPAYSRSLLRHFHRLWAAR